MLRERLLRFDGGFLAEERQESLVMKDGRMKMKMQAGGNRGW